MNSRSIYGIDIYIWKGRYKQESAQIDIAILLSISRILDILDILKAR